MDLSAQQIESLLVALLAVNSYSVEKVTGLLPAFREARLTEPTFVAEVAKADIGPLIVRLASAGYDRGLRTEIFAQRVLALMEAINRGQLSALPAMVSARKESDAIASLTMIPGIGPRVAATAWSLLTQ